MLGAIDASYGSSLCKNAGKYHYLESVRSNFSKVSSDKVLIWLNLEIREFREFSAWSTWKQFSHRLGHKETLAEAACDVRF